MSNYIEYINSILVVINDYVWGWPMLILLFGTHIFLTFRLSFIQKFIPLGIRLSII